MCFLRQSVACYAITTGKIITLMLTPCEVDIRRDHCVDVVRPGRRVRRGRDALAG